MAAVLREKTPWTGQDRTGRHCGTHDSFTIGNYSDKMKTILCDTITVSDKMKMILCDTIIAYLHLRT